MAHLLHLYRTVTFPSRQSPRGAASLERPDDRTSSGTAIYRRRAGIWGELALAVPPTLVVLAVLFAVESVTRQRLLFASLASSAFLIYSAPLDHMNGVRVMLTAQGIGCAAGVLAALVLGGGYGAGALAMVGTILLLITLDVIHPPAISTALGFAFVTPQDRTLLLFAVALVLLGMLVILQRLATWTLHRIQQRLEQ